MKVACWEDGMRLNVLTAVVCAGSSLLMDVPKGASTSRTEDPRLLTGGLSPPLKTGPQPLVS